MAVSQMRELTEISVHSEWHASGGFSSTLEEVIAQIPAEHLNSVSAFSFKPELDGSSDQVIVQTVLYANA